MKKFGMPLAMAWVLALAACGDDNTLSKIDVNKGRNDCEKMSIITANAMIDYCEKNKKSCKACECMLERKELKDGQCVKPEDVEDVPGQLPEKEMECSGESQKMAKACLEDQKKCKEGGEGLGEMMCKYAH